MKIAIHQPEHFPYLGFFQKMTEADLFVILDDVKFKKNNFQNRNRFLNKNGVEEWFTVAVESRANSKLINEVCVADEHLWRKKIIKQLEFNFNLNLSHIYEEKKLVDINMRSIEFIRDKLNIRTPLVFSSSLNTGGNKTELLIDICKKTGAAVYLSGQGAKEYLEMNLFELNGIKVEYHVPVIKDYYSSICHIR